MIMRTILYLVYFVKLSEENFLYAEMPDVYNLAANVLQDIKTKLPASRNFHASTITNSESPEISKTSKSVQQFKKHNAYKNQKGYTFSEVFHNGVKDGDGTTTNRNTEVIPESRFLYHSLENPLFKSNSLNLQSEDNNEPIISDVHKISSPFESKWIFVPSSKGLGNRVGQGLGSSTFNFMKKSRGIRNPSDSFKSTLNDSIFGNSKLDKKPLGTLAATSTPAVQAGYNSSTEKSFYGYNYEEVKTGDGKIRGVMQIFDKDGLKRNVVYNEKGPVVDQANNANNTKSVNNGKANITASNLQRVNTAFRVQQKPNIPSTQQNNAPVSSKAQQNVTANVADQKNANSMSGVQSTTAAPLIWNNHFSNFTNYVLPLPSDKVTYNQPAVTNSFATPEYILFNFLGQLNSVSFIPSSENFVTNELNSFDETADDNSFFFVVK